MNRERRWWTAVAFVILSLASLMLAVNPGLAQLPGKPQFETPSAAILPPIAPRTISHPALSTTCALQPELNPAARVTPRSPDLPSSSLTLERFRTLPVERLSPKQLPDYHPQEEIALADSSNYGERFLRDVKGNPALLNPIVVLHETVGSANSAINLLRTYHPNDDDQVSYHTLIRQDGTVVYLVPPDKRAFGAGNSIFMGPNGLETVQTKVGYPPSVNNFAYHVSLETPFDGNHNGTRHSGYSEAQYQSLAWLVGQTDVEATRITTHKAVDRSRSRMDPRSFDPAKFSRLLSTYPRTAAINIRCTDPTQPTETEPAATKPTATKPTEASN
jgi:hypothetical protein